MITIESLSLEDRKCLGCGCVFKALPKSKQKFHSLECRDRKEKIKVESTKVILRKFGVL